MQPDLLHKIRTEYDIAALQQVDDQHACLPRFIDTMIAHAVYGPGAAYDAAYEGINNPASNAGKPSPLSALGQWRAARRNVQKVLDLSTGHLRQETRDALDAGTIVVTVLPHPEGYGWLILVPYDFRDEDPDYGVPDDLRRVFELARELGCYAVMFDADAEGIDGLPWYEDEL